jgi:hypothetical protein
MGPPFWSKFEKYFHKIPQFAHHSKVIITELLQNILILEIIVTDFLVKKIQKRSRNLFTFLLVKKIKKLL